jgi:uroporphyrinogen-III decarboxylase
MKKVKCQAMTKRERLIKTFRGEKADRVPINAFHWSVAQRLYGCFCWMHELQLLEDGFDWDPVIRVNVLPKQDHVFHNYIYNIGPSVNEQYHTFYDDLDHVKIDLEITREGNLTEVARTIETGYGRLQDRILQPKPNSGYGWLPMPQRKEPLIKTHDDLKRIFALLNVQPRKNAYEDVRQIIKYVGEKGLVGATFYSPVDFLLAEAMKTEDLLMMYYDDRQMFEEALCLFNDYCIRSITPYLEMGIEFVQLSWYGGSLSFGWSPEIWEKYLYPIVKQHVGIVHRYGAVCSYYDDGKMKRILPFLKEAGVDSVETLTPPPVGDVTLKEVRNIVGSGITLRGGLDTIHVLQNGTRDRIFEEVERLIREGTENGNYVLFPSDPITAETPLENIQWYIEAGRKFGKLT